MIKMKFILALTSMVFFMTFGEKLYAQEVVNVRHADHGNFSRVVFDFKKTVEYQVNLRSNRLEITFATNGTANFGTLAQNPARFIMKPSYRVDNGKLIVTFILRNHGNFQHFRDGTKIAFDILEKQATSRVFLKEDTPSSLPVASEDSSSNLETSAVSAAQDKIDVAKLSAGRDSIIVTKRFADFSQSKLRIFGEDRAGGVVRIFYPLRSLETKLGLLKTASFVKNKKIWMVFDKVIDIDHSLFEARQDDFIEDITYLDVKDRTIIIYSLKTDKFINIGQVNGDWYMDIKDVYLPPAHDIPLGSQRSKGASDNIFMHVGNTGPVIKVFDPDIGDELAIIPLGQVSYGVNIFHQYPQFSVLRSGQGIAIQLISDDLTVTRYKNGVAINSESGLAVSRSKLSSLLVHPSDAAGAEEDDNEQGKNEEGINRLIDFHKWGEGPIKGGGFNVNRHELLYDLSRAAVEDRTALRWDLARFLLSNNNPSEAIGILTVMRDQETGLLENPEYRIVLATTNIELRRYDEGLDLLRHKSFMAEGDVNLWRAVAYDGKGNHRKALIEFEKGKSHISGYEDDNQARFFLIAIKASHALHKFDEMETYLAFLENIRLNVEKLDQYDYWNAKLMEERGDTDGADLVYVKIENTAAKHNSGAGRKLAALAAFTRINNLYTKKEITATEAIDQLERLRFSWRGDDFELDLLSRLGELYVKNHQYRQGLDTLKLATTYFRKSDKTNDLFKLSERLFQELFLYGGANDMDPVRALGLYGDYQILTPAGPKGETMARRLADRLVSLDLHEAAIKLLNHQVDFRLKGIARSDVARRLAMVYILNAQPNEALIVLRKTRASQTPADITRERLLIETRALIELQRYEEAEVMLENMTGTDVDHLRTDILWQSNSWSKVIALSNRLLGNRHQDLKALNNEERQIVLRLAVAYSSNNDKVGLNDLRSRYLDHMTAGRFGDAFDVITADQMTSSKDVRRLARSIASVRKYETFLNSYKKEFSTPN